MTPDDHQRVIDELQTLIDETQHMLTRFEALGMDEELAEDYKKLLTILDNANKQQREHTKALLLV